MNKKTFAVGSALGVLLGTAAALLLAPQSGKKTRKEIQKMARDLSHAVTKQIDKTKKLTQESYNELVDQSVTEYKKGKKMAETAWKKISADLKAQWNDVRNTLQS